MRKECGGSLKIIRASNLPQFHSDTLAHTVLAVSISMGWLPLQPIPPSLHVLEIWGTSSAMATCHFLQWHPNIQQVRLFWSQGEVATLFFNYLNSPLLQMLHRYLYQTLHIFECNLPQPSLHDRVIEANPLTDVWQFKFFDGVMHCLTMCQGCLTLQILLPKQSWLSPLTLKGAREHTARKLRSTKLPEIESLCIGFVDMGDSIPVHSYSVDDLIYCLY